MSYCIETLHVILVYTYLCPRDILWENVDNWESYQDHTKVKVFYTPFSTVVTYIKFKDLPLILEKYHRLYRVTIQNMHHLCHTLHMYTTINIIDTCLWYYWQYTKYCIVKSKWPLFDWLITDFAKPYKTKYILFQLTQMLRSNRSYLSMLQNIFLEFQSFYDTGFGWFETIIIKLLYIQEIVTHLI